VCDIIIFLIEIVVILFEGIMKNYKQDRTKAQILIMQIFKNL